MESDGEGDRRSKRRREEDIGRQQQQQREPRGRADDLYEYHGRHREARGREDDPYEYHGRRREPRGRDDDHHDRRREPRVRDGDHEYHDRRREPRGRDDDPYEYHDRRREARGRDDDSYKYHGRRRESRGRGDDAYQHGPCEYDTDSYQHRGASYGSRDRRGSHRGDGRDPGLEGDGGDPKRESDRGRTNGYGKLEGSESGREQKQNRQLICDDEEHDRDSNVSMIGDVAVSSPKPISVFDPPTAASVQVPELAATPSECLVLNIAFDQVSDKKKSDPMYIRYRILQKCAEAGGVDHIHVDTKRGVVYLRFRTARISMLAQKVFHGDFYEGNLITTGFMDPRRYFRMFPITN